MEDDLAVHKEIVDAYIALGYDLDRITITKGYYQPDAARILKGYGIALGAEWGDAENDRGRYRDLPQDIVNEFVTAFFPGGENADLEGFLAARHPGWEKDVKKKTRIFSRRLTEEEIEAGKKEWKRLY